MLVGGRLSDRKGINRLGGGLTVAALSDKDRADIVLAAELDADFLAVSFVKTAADIEQARTLLHAAGGKAALVAKILRGARPQDLPVEGAEKIDLAVNLKTAEQFGLTVPRKILLRADAFRR